MDELISRAGLEAFIVKPENLEALEDNIGWRGDQYLQLKRKEDSLDLKTKIPIDRLAGLFSEVQRQMTQTLDINDLGKIWFSEYDFKWYLKIGLQRGAIIAAAGQLVSFIDGFQAADLSVGPAILTFFGVGVPVYALREFGTTHYEPSQGTILIGYGNKTEATTALAFSQGQAEHLLHKNTYLYEESTPLTHGFILNMGRMVGEKLSKQHNNPVYNYQSLNGYLGELKDAYLTICQKQGKTPRGSLDNLTVSSPRTFLDKAPGFYDRWTYPLSLATATLAASELRFGEDVYKKVLAEDFSFLLQ